MKSITKKLFIASILLLIGYVGNAQQIDSVLNIYSDQFQQEKIHIHFDKNAYNQGETIWFKAYLMAGLEPSGISKIFYADWYDANGKLIAHNFFPVFEASAKGQFDIPDNYTFSSLHLHAYTKWMLNFDSSFLFDKDIVISQPVVQKNSTIAPITALQFFPEGGDLVDGLAARIGFIATNQSGKPVNIKGAIKNSKNELIDSIATEHDGMGSFMLDDINADEIYSVFWTDEYGQSNVMGLPNIKKSGVAIQTQSLNNKIRMAISRSVDKSGNLQTLYLMAHMNQQVLYKYKINAENRNAALLEVNTSNFPTGILQLTVFNALWQPVAERIVFVNNHQYQFNPIINTITKGVDKRKKNVIEIDVSDSAIANLSITITDAGLSQEKNSIISQFLLSGELKGKINNPSFYFDNNADSTKHFLDLLMLTHGWRKFKWDEIAQSKLPAINYPRDSEYIQITGIASGRAFDRVEEKDFITLILLGRDSSKQIVPVPMEQNGTFSKGGFIFFDTVRAYYSFKQKKLADKTNVDFQSNILSVKNTVLRSVNNYSFKQFDSAQLAREQFFIDEQKRLEKLMSETTLKEVVVHAWEKPKTKLDIVDEKYTAGAFSFESRFRFDIATDPIALSSFDMFKYLQSRVAGLEIFLSPEKEMAGNSMSASATGSITMSTASSNSSAYQVIWRGEVPDFYLNESPTDIDMLSHIPMTEIAFIKVFPPPFVGSWQNGRGGAISVYTRKAGEGYNPNDFDDKKLLAGYTKYKEFYSPKYNDSSNSFIPDVRTTLYWNPYILTDSRNHKVQVEFYNNDLSKKLRIVLEGFNSEGKLAHIEKVLE
jgi:hypothetical protein